MNFNQPPEPGITQVRSNLEYEVWYRVPTNETWYLAKANVVTREEARQVKRDLKNRFISVKVRIYTVKSEITRRIME
jgi:hypothetical protein